MARPVIDMSSRGRTRVYVVTVAGTLFCIAAALFLDSFNFMALPAEERLRPILTSILIPLALAAPLLFFFMEKLRQLAIAQRDLQILASTDSLTAVLNRGAFTMLVDEYLERATRGTQRPSGALLVVDADHFKSINDRFGHDQGDVALQLIASSIRDEIRGADLVGRIGGEEFGVFLPGATPEQAKVLAERIRLRIASLEFEPDGVHRPLSVSIGGTGFAEPIAFAALYRAADGRLYRAKQTGRNRVDFGVIPLAA